MHQFLKFCFDDRKFFRHSLEFIRTSYCLGYFDPGLYVLGLPNLYHPRDCVDSFDRQKTKRLNFDSQRREADLRASLLAKRINAEAIAGMRGVEAERARLMTTFSSLLMVLVDTLRKKRNLEYFSVGAGQITHLTPIFLFLPAFFSGAIELGD